jgi:1,2-phenylacetyl-CoA epoxidase catalytic subunit
MDVEELTEDAAAEEERYEEVFRYYQLAKRAEWQLADMPWNDLAPIPELKGSPQRQARRRDVWRSVITQQLQADQLAVEMSAQLFSLAPHNEAKLYYTTMVQDEARHTEAWLKLVEQVGGTAERDPYLDQMARMTLDAETLEEKVFLMQVFFERLIIPKFRMIARSSRGTILEDLCNRLAVDDGIHHGAGMAYERVLLQRASKKTKGKLIDAGNRLLPVFVNHELWRPRERAWIGSAMRSADIARLRHELENGIRMAQSLGLDVSGIELPRLAA